MLQNSFNNNNWGTGAFPRDSDVLGFLALTGGSSSPTGSGALPSYKIIIQGTYLLNFLGFDKETWQKMFGKKNHETFGHTSNFCIFSTGMVFVSFFCLTTFIFNKILSYRSRFLINDSKPKNLKNTLIFRHKYSPKEILAWVASAELPWVPRYHYSVREHNYFLFIFVKSLDFPSYQCLNRTPSQSSKICS